METSLVFANQYHRRGVAASRQLLPASRGGESVRVKDNGRELANTIGVAADTFIRCVVKAEVPRASIHALFE